MFRTRSVFVLLTLLVSASWSVPAASDEPIEALFVTGGGNYDIGIFRVVESLEGVNTTRVDSDVEAFAEPLDAIDVVVLYNVSRSLPEPQRQHLQSFVEAGGGVVVLHHALASYGDWRWWWNEVTGGRYLLGPDGDLRPSRYTPSQSIVASMPKEHPITAPLGGLPVHFYDETYSDLWLSAQNDVLLRTGLASSDGPLLWVGPYPSGRVVAFQLGHGSGAHWNLGFRVLLRQSILWAGGRLSPAPE